MRVMAIVKMKFSDYLAFSQTVLSASDAIIDGPEMSNGRFKPAHFLIRAMG